MQQNKNDNSKALFNVTDIPLGSWDARGNWMPNYRLEMTVAQQRRHNIMGGHFLDQAERRSIDYSVKIYADADEKTLIDRFIGWVKL
jgi:hypothetical protein